MTYEEIMGTLETIEMLLANFERDYGERADAAQALVTLHNNYCSDCNMMDDYIMDNTADELAQLLPSDPLQAFYDGRNSIDQYSPNDDWLTVDGYAHPVTCTHSMLVGKFVFLSDIASWLADKDDEEQEELLSELIEIAHEYSQD